MKKLIVVILALSILINCACATALAASYVHFSGNCNVRTGPGLGYKSIGSVNRGSTLSYSGSTRYDSRGVAWYSVSFGGRTAWVSSVYGSLTNQNSGITTYGAGANGYDEQYDGYYYGDYDDSNGYSGDRVRATGGDTHVRTGPGLGYRSIGVLYQGQSVSYADDTSVDNRGVAWYAIHWNGNVAWVSSMYTSLY